MFVDDKNLTYLSNIKNKSIQCLNQYTNLIKKEFKIFRLSTSIGQEQFVFGSREWMDGYDFSMLEEKFENNSFVFAFYRQKTNEANTILWNFN